MVMFIKTAHSPEAPKCLKLTQTSPKDCYSPNTVPTVYSLWARPRPVSIQSASLCVLEPSWIGLIRSALKLGLLGVIINKLYNHPDDPASFSRGFSPVHSLYFTHTATYFSIRPPRILTDDKPVDRLICWPSCSPYLGIGGCTPV